ncbi:MAG: EamA family transporter [Candidatus Hodarchaeales archaeon]
MAVNPLFSLFLGLGAASSWASGDFSGGVASKRYKSLTVVIVSQVFGVFFLLSLTMLVFEESLSLLDIFYGAIGGFSLAIGLVALYHGLASGRMGVVAPVASVTSALIPAFFGVLVEGIPPVIQMIGLIIALFSIWLVAGSNSEEKVHLSDLKIALIAGLGFSSFRIFITQMSGSAVLAPLLVTRIASMLVLVSFAGISQQVQLPKLKSVPLMFLAGFFDVLGGILFILAAQLGRIDVASIFSSTQPAFTVLLAFGILKERIYRRQWIGLIGIVLSIVVFAL